MIKSIVKNVLRLVLKDKMMKRKFRHTDVVLWFRVSDHLSFLFCNQIEYEFSDLLKMLVKPGDVVFDIGANIGQFSLQLSKWVGENGSVIAFEPDRDAANYLKNNIAKNNIQNCTVMQAAISDANGKEELFIDSTTGGRRNSLNVNEVGNYKGHVQEVTCMSLENCIERFGVPKIVKIDVEGFEHKLFLNPENIIPNVIYLIEIISKNKKEIFEKFRNKSFDIFQVIEKKNIGSTRSISSYLLPMDKVNSKELGQVANYVFIHVNNISRLENIDIHFD